MTDMTQGQDAPNDSALFNEAVTAETLEKFENPPVAPEPKEPPAPPPEPPKPTDPPPKEDAPVPPGRLREEADARRRAERERDELRMQIAAMSRAAPPSQEQPPAIDLIENPKGFVQQELRPFLDQLRADFQSQREAMSLNWALDKHGEDAVASARQALEQGMARGDPNAWGTYNRAMQSHDPYGIIVRAHREAETLRTIGGDLDGYRKRVLDEALADPEYRKRVFEAAKGQAPNVHRPAVTTQVASSPSLGNIGASGGDQQIIEPSDAELFRAATQAKRR